MANYTPNFGLNYNGYQNPGAYMQPQNMMTTQPYTPQFGSTNLQNDCGIPGRVIKDIKEVVTNEVPMDGRVSLFPKEDYSCIYAKTWGSNGVINTIKFVPEPQPEESGVIEARVVDGSSKEILDRLDALDDKIERLAKRNNYHKPYKKNYHNNKPYNKNQNSGQDSKE